MTSVEQPLFHQDADSDTAMINLSECSECGHRSFPPVLLGCEQCGALPHSLRYIQADAIGRIVSSALVSNPGGKSFTVATIKLEDGPAVRALVDTPAEPESLVKGEIITGDQSPRLVFRAT